MTAVDKKFFPSDLREYNFKDFSHVYYLGMRAYIMNEIYFDRRRAVFKVRLLQIAHTFVLVCYYGGLLLLIYLLGRYCGIISGYNDIYNSFQPNLK